MTVSVAYAKALLSSTPYDQIIVICFLNTLMFLNLIVARPLVSLKMSLFMIWIEALTNTTSDATAFLANLDRSDKTDTEQRISAGWVIFVSEILITFTIATVYLLLIGKVIIFKIIPSI